MTCAWCGQPENVNDPQTRCFGFGDTSEPVCGYCINVYRSQCDTYEYAEEDA